MGIPGGGIGGAGPATAAYLVHGPARGSWNMAVDETLMRGATSRGPALRFYRWTPPCLSFGRNQRARERYDLAGAPERIDAVRRPTGGRAVYHHRELTYSVTGPVDQWGSLRRSYERINRGLKRGLERLGVPAGLASPAGRAPGPSSRACFRDPLPGEVVAGGRKLVGSAQWRSGGALLQHGSILLGDDQCLAESLLVESGRKGPSMEEPEAGAASLSEFLRPLPSLEEIIAALARALSEELELDLRRRKLSEAERSMAGELEARYRDDAWTWRR